MSVRKALAAAGIVALSIAGGAVGATLFGTANAATPSPSPTTESGTAGTPHSNEDPAHEAGESAEREAAENNGTADFGHHGGGPGGFGGGFRGGSNEDPTHEAGESAQREAAENEAANGGTTAPAPSATLNP
ncbi:MAG: hypothetical protein QOE99_2293 [Actinomycetota bacterium]|jgi:hypothetical protein|nr:hypothetical protein [Actinomycetota bacterium]